MNPRKYKRWFTNPAIITVLSTVVSILVYSILGSLIGLSDFYFGLILSTVIPITVALPVSLLINSYLQKIQTQNKKLAQLDNDNKKLFSILAHDLRSPIASLKGVLDLVGSDDLDHETSRPMLQDLSKKTDNLLDFLNEILNWSKEQMTSGNAKATPFSTSKIIEQTVDLYQEKIAEKDIKLSFGNVSGKAYADKDAYAFIVRNLLQNALKFTKPKGQIEIDVSQQKNQIVTTVKDSGIGISKEHLKKIYNAGNWFTTTGLDGEQGTGFGLNTCFRFARENKGKLVINSELNLGTEISLSLPLAR